LSSAFPRGGRGGGGALPRRVWKGVWGGGGGGGGGVVKAASA